MEAIIKEAYQENFETAYETFKIAIKRNPPIRLQDVKYYLNKLESVQVKLKYKKYNSFVSPKAGFEFEIGIIDVLARDGGDGITYGLCAIDNFAKKVSVIPISNRKPTEILIGLKLIFEQLGKPKQLYSDGQSSLRSQEFFRFVKEIILKLFRH